MDYLSILPNLSIGVVAVVSLAWYAYNSQKTMQAMHSDHVEQVTKMHENQMRELNERENAIRAIEKEVRTSITSQLVKNSQMMDQVIRALNR